MTTDELPSIDSETLEAVTGGCACGCGQANCSCVNGSRGQRVSTATPMATNPYQFQYRWGR